MRFNYGKIFLLGFGFFGVSVIWGVYNAFVMLVAPFFMLLALLSMWGVKRGEAKKVG